MGDLLKAATDVAAQYHECKIAHSRLIDVVEARAKVCNEPAPAGFWGGLKWSK